MIARMWHGTVPVEKAGDYHEFLKRTGLHDFSTTPGNKGALLLTRQEGDITHFHTLSFWENMKAIELFAGSETQKARYYPSDPDFLIKLEPFVKHFEVASASWPIEKV